MSLLQRILVSKRSELDALRQRRWTTPWVPRPVQLGAAGSLDLIAEIKFKSPSAGALSTALSVGDRSRCYEAGGARMISVLCDGPFFGGAYAHLTEARRASELPLLCKEFILDEVQLDAALEHGADAVLLIVRCLDDGALECLIRAAEARRLTPVVEISDEEEARRALDAGACTIGVNGRNLDTLQMNRLRALEILAGLPRQVTRLAFSGFQTRRDVVEAERVGANGALIGEVLMKRDDPSSLLRDLAG